MGRNLRHPRTLQEAFGPYTSNEIAEVYKYPRWVWPMWVLWTLLWLGVYLWA